MAKKAIIVGASGLIGSNVLSILLEDAAFESVLILVRRELPHRDKRLKQMVVDFNRLSEYELYMPGAVVFCCLGSTRGKTPDLNDYRKIDHDYPLMLAQIAVKENAEQFHLVSSIGADASSSNFYTKMKGETEEDVKNTGLKSLHIYRPSVLTGPRQERRPAERIIIWLMKLVIPFLLGALKRYRSIPAAVVAAAMVKQSLKNEEGLFIYSSDQITKLT